MTITLRRNKGTALTFDELDNNFDTLNQRTSNLDSLVSTSLETADGTTTAIAGAGIVLQPSVDATSSSATIKLSKFLDATGQAAATATQYDVLTNVDLTATTASAGTTGIAYDSSTKTITYTPPDLTSFLTSSSSIDLSTQTLTGTLPTARLPNISLTSVTTVASQAAQLALTTEEGDVVIRSDENKSYIRNSGTADPHDMTNFSLLATPDTDTTYGISIEQTDSTDTDPTLNLTPNQGSADTITIKGGGATTVTRTDSGESVTINTPAAPVTSVDGNTGAVTTLQLGTSSTTALAGDTALLQLGTSSTTALAGDTTFAFADITSKPTTISGYGITDALTIGTTATTAMAGNTTFAFADITSKPTTISGYGITDALAIGTTATTAMAGNTTFAFSDITSKPTTISGYGITDALQLGTSSTTALAGDTALLQIGTSSTTALAGDTVVDNLLLEIPKSSASVNIGDKSFLKVAEVTIDARYEYYSAQLAVVGTGAAEGVANEKILAIRVKQQAAMGSAPLVDIDIYNNGNEDYDFGHVVAVNSATETRVDIYFRPDGPNSGAEVYKMADTATATVAWSSAGNSYATSAPANFVQGGAHQQWHSGNQAGIFGTTNGILKADGNGVLSAAVGGTSGTIDYSTVKIGTGATDAMAGNTTFAFSDITSKPTTISGYGITDALAIGTTATTAMAGNTALSAIGGSLDLSSQVTGTLPVGNMAATALTTVQTAANQAAQLALTTQEGDVVVRTDENKTYMRNSGTANPHDMTNFTLLATPTDAVTSVDGNTGAVTTLQIGTTATTAMAGNTTFAFADITSKPTTISGYGITDALEIGTSSTTAMAGDTTFAFADITSKPTTISGYGITDALAIGTSSTTAMAGDTTFAFADITSKPTTISGYGITDALAIGTTSTTAMAGDTTFAFADITSKPTTISGYGITDALAIGTTATTAMAGNTTFDRITEGDTSIVINDTGNPPSLDNNIVVTVAAGQKAKFDWNGTEIAGNNASDTITLGSTSGTGAITVGRSTGSQTVNINSAATASGSTATVNIGTSNSAGTKAINIGTGGGSGSISNIEIGTNSGTSGVTRNINIGGSNGTASSTINMYGSINLLPANSSTSVIIGGTTQSGNIIIGRSTAGQDVSIASATTGSGITKEVDIAQNGTSGSTRVVNIASSNSQYCTTTVNIGSPATNTSSDVVINGEVDITKGITGNGAAEFYSFHDHEGGTSSTTTDYDYDVTSTALFTLRDIEIPAPANASMAKRQTLIYTMDVEYYSTKSEFITPETNGTVNVTGNHLSTYFSAGPQIKSKGTSSMSQNLGTATYHSSPSFVNSVWTFTGDVTDKIVSGFGALGLSASGSGMSSSSIGDITSCYYQPSDNKTYIRYSSYYYYSTLGGGTSLSIGDTVDNVYYSPTRFQPTGTYVSGKSLAYDGRINLSVPPKERTGQQVQYMLTIPRQASKTDIRIAIDVASLSSLQVAVRSIRGIMMLDGSRI